MVEPMPRRRRGGRRKGGVDKETVLSDSWDHLLRDEMNRDAHDESLLHEESSLEDVDDRYCSYRLPPPPLSPASTIHSGRTSPTETSHTQQPQQQHPQVTSSSASSSQRGRSTTRRSNQSKVSSIDDTCWSMDSGTNHSLSLHESPIRIIGSPSRLQKSTRPTNVFDRLYRDARQRNRQVLEKRGRASSTTMDNRSSTSTTASSSPQQHHHRRQGRQRSTGSVRSDTATVISRQESWSSHDSESIQERLYAQQADEELFIYNPPLPRFTLASPRKKQQLAAAAVSIQGWWRHKLWELDAVVVLQQWGRRWMEQRRYQRLLWVTVRIQAMVRRKRVRRLHAICCTIRRRALVESMAAARIQRVWQGYRHYTSLNQTINSATVVDGAVCGFVDTRDNVFFRDSVLVLQSMRRRRSLDAQQDAAVKMQRMWRAKRTISVVHEKAAAVIQQYWRRYCALCLLALTQAAVTLIQATFRGFRLRRSYAAYMQEMEEMQQEFRDIKDDVRQLQSSFWYRDSTADSGLGALSATRIQSCWRRYRVLAGFAHCSACVIFIQAMVRGYQTRRVLAKSMGRRKEPCPPQLDDEEEEMEESASYVPSHPFHVLESHLSNEDVICARLEAELKAALVIQRWWKPYSEESLWIRDFVLAMAIQACYRGYRTRIAYQELRTSAITIQRVWRKWQAGGSFSGSDAHLQRGYVPYEVCKSHAKQLPLVKTNLARELWAAQQLQYAAFCFLERLRLHRAATVIQTKFRSYLTRDAYEDIMLATLTIQAFYRRTKMRMRAKAASKLQLEWQNWHSGRSTSGRQEESVVCIQKHWRSWLNRDKLPGRLADISMERSVTPDPVSPLEFTLGAKNRSAAAIQSAWGSVAEDGDTASGSSLRIQAAFRRHRQQTRYISVVNALRCLQARHRYRSFSAQKVDSALRIQTTWRRFVVASEYALATDAVVKIQSAARGRRSRHAFQKALGDKRERGAVVIQACTRGLLVRSKLGADMMAMDMGAIALQKQWRGFTVRRRMCESNSCLLESAVNIQRVHRGYLGRQFARKMCLVTILQKLWRGHVEREYYNTTLESARKIEKASRGYLARRFVQKVNSAIAVQKFWRGHAQRSVYKATLEKVVVLQKLSRRYRSRQLLKSVRCAVNVQKLWRGHVQRETNRAAVDGACMIEKLYRGHLSRRFVNRVKCAVVVQTVWRGHVQRKSYTSTLRSARVIEKEYRDYLSRRFTKTCDSAAIMQRMWREHVANKKLGKLRCSSLEIQRVYRGCVARRFIQKIRCVVALQKLWRGCVERKYYNTAVRSAMKIEKVFRGHLAREFVRKVHSAITVQKLGRGHVQRKIYIAALESALVLQKLSRGYRSRQLIKGVKSTIILQKVWRGSVQRNNFEATRENAVTIERVFRGHLSREVTKQLQFKQHRHRRLTKLQAVARGYLAHKRCSATRVASIKVQRMWKAASFRAKLHSSPPLVSVTDMQLLESRKQVMRASAALRIQTLSRQVSSKKRCAERKRATIKLQSWFRGEASRFHDDQRQAAAMLIQLEWRIQTVIRQQEIYRGRCISRIQRAWRRRLLSKKQQDRSAQAARTIRTAFLIWKMDCALLKLESASVLLYRSIQGPLSQTTTLFSLKQINSCLQWKRSSGTELLARMGKSSFAQQISWKRAEGAASHFASIAIQRRYRGYKCREVLLREVSSGRVPYGESVRPLWIQLSTFHEEDSVSLPSPVAANVLSRITKQRTRIKKRVTDHLCRQHSARVLQDAVRRSQRRRREKLESIQRRGLETFLWQIEKEAADEVSQLLASTGNGLPTNTCIARLVLQVKDACEWPADSESAVLLATPTMSNLPCEPKFCFTDKTPTPIRNNAAFLPTLRDSLAALTPIAMADGWDMDSDVE